MSKLLQSEISRRRLLQGGAAVVGAGAVAPLLSAQAIWTAPEMSRVSVWLHETHLAPDALLAKRLRSRYTRIIALRDDPVRQWRDESAGWFAQRDSRLLGTTRWSTFLILRGMAAESRRHVRFTSEVTEDGVLTWLIA